MTDPEAKAGVMIRASYNENDPHVFIGVKNMLTFQKYTSAGNL
jgi:hypothetical protein